MSDPFEEHFQQWLDGIRWEEKCKHEEANVTELLKGLRERSHLIIFDYSNHHIIVDGTLVVTLRVAREMQPEMLLQWVEERLQVLAYHHKRFQELTHLVHE